MKFHYKIHYNSSTWRPETAEICSLFLLIGWDVEIVGYMAAMFVSRQYCNVRWGVNVLVNVLLDMRMYGLMFLRMNTHQIFFFKTRAYK